MLSGSARGGIEEVDGHEHVQPAAQLGDLSGHGRRPSQQGRSRGRGAHAAALGRRRAVGHRRRRPDRASSPAPATPPTRRFNRSYPRGFAADAAYVDDAARPAERPREPDQGRQDRHPARRHLELPPAGPLPHPRGRRGPARDLGHRLGLAGGEQEGHQHEPHHAVLLQARRDLLLLRGDRRGARQLPRRSRQLRRPHHDAASATRC